MFRFYIVLVQLIPTINQIAPILLRLRFAKTSKIIAVTSGSGNDFRRSRNSTIIKSLILNLTYNWNYPAETGWHNRFNRFVV